ncbi:hypothetical protein ADK53_28685 [Streptomyces sp. WM6373]|uniref:hypothetical protein n=1 Tax=Streptomyces sp. WM6373 TaxID=1415556 RepID=UPI0006AEE774|nr:hypothetical protein [Streptomyces sp. WM6373]KOU30197.1 hypothetical protein ADK53_28685 [Streptomyces sp. WM6373]
MPENAWPAGVVARYLTKAAEILGEDITVDVAEAGGRATATCRGCGSECRNDLMYANVTVLPWAIEHAETCRAMPRPTA